MGEEVHELAAALKLGKGKRLRTVPVPSWSKELLNAWLRHSGVNEGKVFRRVLKGEKRQEAGVTANVVWYAVKRWPNRPGLRIPTPLSSPPLPPPVPPFWRRTGTGSVS